MHFLLKNYPDQKDEVVDVSEFITYCRSQDKESAEPAARIKWHDRRADKSVSGSSEGGCPGRLGIRYLDSLWQEEFQHIETWLQSTPAKGVTRRNPA